MEELQRSGGTESHRTEKADVERKGGRVLAREHVCLKGIYV